jgi:hypothetical protein
MSKIIRWITDVVGLNQLYEYIEKRWKVMAIYPMTLNLWHVIIPLCYSISFVAFRINWAISVGCDTSDAWLEGIEIVVAFISFANICSTAGGIRWSFSDTWNHVGSCFQAGGQFFGIHASNDGRIMIFAGGIPLKRNGKVVGAISVSGGSDEQDQTVAEAGAVAFPGEDH